MIYEHFDIKNIPKMKTFYIFKCNILIKYYDELNLKNVFKKF